MNQMNNENNDATIKPEVEAEEQAFSSKLRRYDGAQVWRIVVQNDKREKLADELQTNTMDNYGKRSNKKLTTC
ncbi:hypothetical protein DOY81_011084 [Sarcophaga bullata]|nr:hypothetical protein DOY81_011084 [Sarcophaga bullata]